jgi:hypothetical protein
VGGATRDRARVVWLVRDVGSAPRAWSLPWAVDRGVGSAEIGLVGPAAHGGKLAEPREGSVPLHCSLCHKYFRFKVEFKKNQILKKVKSENK